MGVPPAGAATIPGTTTADTVANEGQCSLREAIDEANYNGGQPPVHDCASGDGDAADTITLPAVPTRSPAAWRPASR